MSKILCKCGQVIFDQTDYNKNKAHLIADQDYMDFLNEAENRPFSEISYLAVKYFAELFQCQYCHRLILLRRDHEHAAFFIAEDPDKSKEILRSYAGNKWPGFISATYRNGNGEIYWNTNLESGFRQNLSLHELKEIYNKKFEELVALKLLRHSFLQIDELTEHQFDVENSGNN